ncbi:MAG: hypothetical protein COU51_04160 [Parcubacteria group bacterium CG10_big_fil_rev_8_21_14_0_10_36_14]|nr:MAG: hypothetical protein COU51_04160 [Parcubacteria group bacterium CG10_big_fil_rev_8_21_14_0_10_36_14]
MNKTPHNCLNNDKIFIIAEAGKNFIQTENGRPISEYLENAKKLVLEAKKAGADAIKFQTHNVYDEQLDINVISSHFKSSDRYSWVTRNTLATPMEFWTELKNFCDKIGIIFFSTPMSRGAAKKINHLIPFWKVGSGDILDFVMLDYLADTKKPIILSSGMSTLEETDLAINFLKKRGAEIHLLHCVSKYPCAPEDLKLNTIPFLNERYGIRTGFSDHSLNITSVLVAVSLGAKIVEKHFSLDRNLWGSDHKVSLIPKEMAELVKKVRSLEKNHQLKEKIATLYKKNIYEDEGKDLQEGEAVFRPLFRKSLIIACDIKADEKITSEKIYAMRPQKYIEGLPSEDYEKILNKPALKDIKKYCPISKELIT